MSTSPAEQPGSGIVTFTQQGDRALDRLAADLVDHCDGSIASIADVLEQVLSADIAELADKLGESLVADEAGLPPRVPTMQPVDASAPTGPLSAAHLPRHPGSAVDAPVTRARAPPAE